MTLEDFRWGRAAVAFVAVSVLSVIAFRWLITTLSPIFNDGVPSQTSLSLFAGPVLGAVAGFVVGRPPRAH